MALGKTTRKQTRKRLTSYGAGSEGKKYSTASTFLVKIHNYAQFFAL